MQGMNYWALVVAALAAFVASSVYYIAFAKQRMKLSPAATTDTKRPPPLKMLVEIGRNLILAFVTAYLIEHTGVAGSAGAVPLALLLWVGFPFILLTGSIMWENVPWKLVAIHSGDWLIKLLLIAAILGAWR